MKAFYPTLFAILIGALCLTLGCEEDNDADDCSSNTDTSNCDCSDGQAANDSDWTATHAEMQTTVENYFQYVNDEKLDELLALFHPEIELHGPFGYGNTQGIEGITPFYELVFAGPIHVDTPIEFFFKENQVAVAIDAKGGMSEANIKTAYAMDWFVFEDGKIKFLSIHFDSTVFMQ